MAHKANIVISMTRRSEGGAHTGVRLFILDLRIRLKGLRPPPSPPTMPLKFKPGEETSVIEGLRAEVPGIPPPPPLLAPRKNPGRANLDASKKTLGGLFWPRRNLGRAILAAERLGRALFWLGKTMCTRTFWKFDIQTLYF